MAYDLRIIPKTDFQPSVGVGVALPFSSPSVFRTTYTTKDAVRNNLINYFLTEPGERIENPNYGGGLRSFVFSQIAQDNLQDLRENISVKISNNFPLVDVKALDVLTIPDENVITVVIKYIVKNTGIEDQIQFNFT